MPSPSDRPRILVVDDHAVLAETIADGLLENGYEALVVTSAEEALRLLRSERIDAVVTDVRMPGTDGLTLLRAAVALDPRRPVTVMTADGSLETALEATLGGTCQYVIKPFRIALLARLLGESLGARRDPQ